jgi:hypothetical protein
MTFRNVYRLSLAGLVFLFGAATHCDAAGDIIIKIQDPDKLVIAILQPICTIVAKTADWINGTTRRKIPQLTTDMAVLAGQKLSLAEQLKFPLRISGPKDVDPLKAQFVAIIKSLDDLEKRISEMDPGFAGSHTALVVAANEAIDDKAELLTWDQKNIVLLDEVQRMTASADLQKEGEQLKTLAAQLSEAAAGQPDTPPKIDWGNPVH